MPGLILEGIVGAGKTTLFRMLAAHPHVQARLAAVRLPEHYTERAYEHFPDRGLIESLELLEHVLAPLEALVALHAQGKFAQDSALELSWIVDRLHLSHSVMFAGGRFEPYRPIEDRLLALGSRIALLQVDDETLARRLRSTRAERGERWNWYLDTKVARRTAGMSDEDVERVLVGHYLEQQREMLELAEASGLPVLLLETDDGAWEAYTERLVAFWGL